MSNSQHEVQVLSFQKGIHQATIVTDGERTKSFEHVSALDHPSLHKAIAYLESHGYSIIPDAYYHNN